MTTSSTEKYTVDQLKERETPTSLSPQSDHSHDVGGFTFMSGIVISDPQSGQVLMRVRGD